MLMIEAEEENNNCIESLKEEHHEKIQNLKELN